MFRKLINLILPIHRLGLQLICLAIGLLLLSSCASASNIVLSGPVISATQSIGLVSSGKLTLPSSSGQLSSSKSPSATPAPTSASSPTSVITSSTHTAKKPNQAAGSITSTAQTLNLSNIKTVFVIVMENHNWSDIFKNPSAPYINQSLLPQASFATQYFNPPGNHPSEPNYLWLEAGTNYGVSNDNNPTSNHQSSTDHLVTYLDKAGITWKAYEEGISGKACPLTSDGLYAPKHNPMIFFDNVTGTNNLNSTYCITHERPYAELQSDLMNHSVAQYNFITPNLCNDMHGGDGCPSSDSIKNGDTWLSQQIPMIMASDAYKHGGVIFITWDESENGDHPIGLIVLSPLAKGGGYSNSIHYTHSSTLRTIQEIFNITPLLGDASKASDLSDLFRQNP